MDYAGPVYAGRCFEARQGRGRRKEGKFPFFLKVEMFLGFREWCVGWINHTCLLPHRFSLFENRSKRRRNGRKIEV